MANVHKFEIFRVINFKQNALFLNFEAENEVEIEIEIQVEKNHSRLKSVNAILVGTNN